MKEFIEQLQERLKDPNLTDEQQKLIEELLRQQAQLYKDLLKQLGY